MASSRAPETGMDPTRRTDRSGTRRPTPGRLGLRVAAALSLFGVAVAAVVVTAFGALVHVHDQRAFRAEAYRLAHRAAEVAATRPEAPLETMRREGLHTEAVLIEIRRPDGSASVLGEKAWAERRPTAEVTIGEKTPVVARVWRDPAGLRRDRAWLIGHGLLLWALAGLGVLGSTRLLASRLTAPVERLARRARTAAGGDLRRPSPEGLDAEAGSLGDNVGRLVGRLAALATRVRGESEDMERASASIEREAHDAQDASRGLDARVEEAVEQARSLEQGVAALREGLVQITRRAAELQASPTSEAAPPDRLTAEDLHRAASEIGELLEENSKRGAALAEATGRMEAIARDVEEAIGAVEGTVRDSETSARQAETLAEGAAGAAQTGSTAVNRALDGMERAAESFEQARASVERLGRRFEPVGQLLEVIDDVAEQTHLLALNASIIAAQAGEHGRSFAVVADEIRQLADRTARSTREIESLVGTFRREADDVDSAMAEGARAVTEGLERARGCGRALEEIVRSCASLRESTQGAVHLSSEHGGRCREAGLALGRLDDALTGAQRVASRAAAELAHGRAIARVRAAASSAEPETGPPTEPTARDVAQIGPLARRLELSSEETLESCRLLAGALESARKLIRECRTAATSSFATAQGLRRRASALQTETADLRIES